MSERAKNQSLAILGAIATVMTIFIQVVKWGEVKATVQVLTTQHEERLKSHDQQLAGLSNSVSSIKGHLGMSARVKPAPAASAPVNVATRQPDSSGPYTTP